MNSPRLFVRPNWHTADFPTTENEISALIRGSLVSLFLIVPRTISPSGSGSLIGPEISPDPEVPLTGAEGSFAFMGSEREDFITETEKPAGTGFPSSSRTEMPARIFSLQTYSGLSRLIFTAGKLFSVAGPDRTIPPKGLAVREPFLPSGLMSLSRPLNGFRTEMI